MDLWTMIVLVVMIGCLTGVATEYMKTKRVAARNSNNDDLEDALDRIDDLEERVRVLEKVVTDEKYDLAREIDSLSR